MFRHQETAGHHAEGQHKNGVTSAAVHSIYHNQNTDQGYSDHRSAGLHRFGLPLSAVEGKRFPMALSFIGNSGYKLRQT